MLRRHSMKFGFRRKKQNDSVNASTDEKRRPPVSVFLTGSGDPNALFSALPAGSEIIAAQNIELNNEQYPSLLLREAGSRAQGDYVLRASLPAAGDAAEFFASLPERSEELILFSKGQGERGAEDSGILERILRREKKFHPSRFGYALSADLYARSLPYIETLPQESAALAPLLLAKSAVFLNYSPFDGHRQESEADVKICAETLVHFFNELKPRLDSLRYRFAFNYVCGKIIAAYAALVHKSDREQLRALDEFLKRENLALRVAADERSPLAFIRSLRKKDFAPTLPARAAAAAVLFREKKEC